MQKEKTSNVLNEAYQNGHYFNRELSWLRFNTRVLNEARNTKLPLLERLKFLAIYSTNLDEFYMIRVAGLQRLFANGTRESGADKLTPLEQLSEIRSYINREKQEISMLYDEIKKSLAKEKLILRNFADLDTKTKQDIHQYFTNYLYQIIVPIVVDSVHPFPHLNNLSFAIAVMLKNKETREIKYGMVRIPRVLKRFVRVNKNSFVFTESIVGEFADELFEGYETIAYMPFRVTRNADMEIEEDEADDFIVLMSEGLKSRKKGEIVRLEVSISQKQAEHKKLLEFVKAQIKISKEDVYEHQTPVGFNSFWEIIGLKEYTHLALYQYVAKVLPPLDDAINIFDCIDEGDVLLFHPYESFDSIINFIQQAAKDPDVLSIRMTLYRVGKNSPIVKALMEATENKQVTVLVELKARFDEENNLHWAKSLESAGAHVIYGIPNLKVHAKIALVIRKKGDKLHEYVHLGTGNYNAQTAKIYTDISFLSANRNFAKDAVKFFHSLSTGSSKHAKLESLYTAPTQIKEKLLELISGETMLKEQGRIIIKANACVDTDIINALYKASQAGVKIDMIIRGICCLKPGIKEISENINVYSIVGKYLEHARIYYFKNAKEPIYFSSADIMPRNLERRIELLTPATEVKIADKLLQILNLQLKDTSQRYELKSDGEYYKVPAKDVAINSQETCEHIANKIYNANKKVDEKIKRLVNRMMGES
ncbi:RNA degradosome polyphosphate kinase [Helicobacter muridarum]|uniref:Polyphosphate kinase n=1 Tax=Helicobacter muridarum TaxID=216 RepID=A0A099TV54_9HELI|nr:RNA degradosome polyphosphate kinase [Helicobacter muridarum]TLE01338.1 RNA degradosome polyphosphate kinase [Helicobacter muridarum]STQ85257.1 polyphosphate kinase [Helicobacter muridarum]